MTTETIEFQAEARQLLQLMIHAIYSSKDVFLRELISNSSDALDKLRLAAFRDKDLDVDTDDLHITVTTDPAASTLTVADNGIGMSREEVVDLIGNPRITAEQLKALFLPNGEAADGAFALFVAQLTQYAHRIFALHFKAGVGKAVYQRT